MLTKKNPKKMNVNLIKYRVKNCPTLPGRNLTSTCNRRIKSVSSKYHLDDLLRIVFIHEKCGNLKVFVDGGELIRNINKKKKPCVLEAYRYPLCGKCYR